MTITQDKRRKAELEIIKELKEVPSSRQMQKLLKEKYNIIANHNTINNDLKQDLESLTSDEYENKKTGILKMLEDEIDIAHDIVKSNSNEELKLKAMNAVSKLSKTKSEILIKFRKANAELIKEEKPNVNIFIGQPKEVDLKKFKKLEGVLNDEKDI